MSEELKYKYHIVYAFRDGNKGGTGSMDTSTRCKFTDSGSVKALKDYIEEDQGFTDVVILSWAAYEKESWFTNFWRLF